MFYEEKSLVGLTPEVNPTKLHFSSFSDFLCKAFLLCNIKNTGGPRYSRTFYLRIRLFTFEKRPKMTLFQSKMDFLSVNSRFAVQNDRTYLPRITRETCNANTVKQPCLKEKKPDKMPIVRRKKVWYLQSVSPI